MKRKLIKIFSCMSLCLLCVSNLADVHAEDYSDSSWAETCSQNPNADGCDGYRDYLQSQINSKNSEIEDLESQRDEIAANISAYSDKLKDLQSQEEAKQTEIDAKQTEIDNKQKEIDAKQVEIDDKQDDIDDTQSEIDSLKGKVKDRMVSAQATMRTSKYVDMLMGAKSFSEFILISNGLNAITEYDEKTFNQLADLVEKLNTEKAELETAKAEMETAKAEMETVKAELVDQQNELILLQEQAQVIIDEYEKQYASVQAMTEAVTESIGEIQDILSKVDTDGVATTSGWTYPVPGAYRSAGTWAYGGGGVHLGYDFAAAQGTTIRAVANGIVLFSTDGCNTGYLGSMCRGAGGAYGGGNQVFLLCKVNGSLYAVSYYHMQLGSPIATGTVVSAGDYIGRVGATGNVTGPHTHVEIFYLGDADNFSNYAQTWSGDLAFGCGWQGSYDGYGRRCDAGYGAPCRIRPETIFGY